MSIKVHHFFLVLLHGVYSFMFQFVLQWIRDTIIISLPYTLSHFWFHPTLTGGWTASLPWLVNICKSEINLTFISAFWEYCFWDYYSSTEFSLIMHGERSPAPLSQDPDPRCLTNWIQSYKETWMRPVVQLHTQSIDSWWIKWIFFM